MAIQNFIPTIWSETLYNELSGQCVAIRNCNREFEGDIRGIGSEVKICGLNPITIQDYTKNGQIDDLELLTDNVRTLQIDHAKCFNFLIDDIDRVQSSPKLMSAALRNAASAIANTIDADIYKQCSDAGSSISFDSTDASLNILNAFIDARNLLYKNNVTDSDNVVFEISPDVAALLFRSKLEFVSNNNAMIENGLIGKIMGCRVYVTNNIQSVTDDGHIFHYCVARTTRSVAYAEQLAEIEAYRPEDRFGDAMKGLYLYGMKVVYPKEMVRMEIDMGLAPVDDNGDGGDGEGNGNGGGDGGNAGNGENA